MVNSVFFIFIYSFSQLLFAETTDDFNSYNSLKSIEEHSTGNVFHELSDKIVKKLGPPESWEKIKLDFYTVRDGNGASIYTYRDYKMIIGRYEDIKDSSLEINFKCFSEDTSEAPLDLHALITPKAHYSQELGFYFERDHVVAEDISINFLGYEFNNIKSHTQRYAPSREYGITFKKTIYKIDENSQLKKANSLKQLGEYLILGKQDRKYVYNSFIVFSDLDSRARLKLRLQRVELINADVPWYDFTTNSYYVISDHKFNCIEKIKK